ncbi:DUF602-domain-containing protein [Neocallimastix lanati (nom. inval.)]|jgi:hypothetical protein|uniref:DUF602-domain-containing protein n=1 Tax=Neocallimastix californiae TaxID=1754190 RepID=A0A1Y2B2K4_9FUNG|nr:DUF602-domain-containing protein [Neocallimastix sp. JGI-2020a]ORY29043.1 DUF602-domain-containing protein [Neocallimastix californiae]|eukprot:ORY29043.1 DUF602-domain-containing protein [Neocallimastix californiae]
MGCDGGTIPKRDELVKTKKKNKQVDKTEQLIANWYYCALSKTPLKEPIVSCRLGKLYNKDAIIKYLLNKKAYGDGDIICKHITSIKDVTTLNLTSNPAYSSSNKHSSIVSSTVGNDVLIPQFVCPITMKEMSGKYKFVYLPCGCVFSEQALKEVPSTVCLQCNKPYNSEDIIPINPEDPEVIESLQIKLNKYLEEKKKKEQEKKLAKKAAKLAKKAEKEKEKDKKKHSLEDESNSDSLSHKHSKKKHSTNVSSNGEHESKKSHHSNMKHSDSTSNINLNLPDLSEITEKTLKSKTSKVIQSMYTKSNDKDDKQNFLCRGTFNRYAI